MRKLTVLLLQVVACNSAVIEPRQNAPTADTPKPKGPIDLSFLAGLDLTRFGPQLAKMQPWMKQVADSGHLASMAGMVIPSIKAANKVVMEPEIHTKLPRELKPD